MSRSVVQATTRIKLLLFLVIMSTTLGQIKCFTGNELDSVMEKLPSYTETTKFMREKCAQNGGNQGAFLALKNETFAMMDCLQDSFDYDTIEQELTNATFIDDVVMKYCNRFPIFQKCVAAALNKAKPCFDKEEIQSMDKTFNLIKEVKDFMCYRNGFRLSFFMVFDGQNCTHLRSEGIQKCFQTAYEDRMQNGASTRFIVNEKLCPDIIKLRTCMVDEYLKCKKSTPAAVIEAGFKVVQRKLDCYKNSAGFIYANLFVFLISIGLSKQIYF